MELIEMMQNRRSVRQYTGEPIEEAKLKLILQAALVAPSSRGGSSRDYIVVRDRDTLEKMSHYRQGAAAMLKNAACAIVVLGNADKCDVWCEDCSCLLYTSRCV